MREQREKIHNGQKGDKRFENEGGWKCCISRVGPDCTVEVCRSEESEEEVTVLQVGMQQGEQLQ